MPVISIASDFQKLSKELSTTNCVYHNTWVSSPNAVMYIFSPRQIPDTYIRPYQFQFSTEFLNDLDSVVSDGTAQLNGSIGGNFTIASKMPGYDSINRSISPSSVGLKFSGSQFDTYYTWVLIIDNDSIKGRRGSTRLSNRLVYMGVCIDEPYVNINGSLTFNDRCLLLPTHFTHINIQPIVDSEFGHIIRVKPMTDTDVVHPQETMQASPNRDYLLRPEDLVTSVGYDSDETMYISPQLGYLGNMQESVCLNTILNNPKEQLGKIVSGLTQTMHSIQMTNRLPPQMDLFNTHIKDDFTIYQDFKNNIKETLPDRLVGIRVDQPILLSDLHAQYPVLTNSTQIFNVPFILPESSMDTSAPTVHNIWVSLLTSCLPAVFNNFGISDASFRYCSINPNTISTFDHGSVCELFELLTYVAQEDSTSITLRWEQALSYLEKFIFPIITTQVGNFDVLVNHKSAGECMVQLQLMDCDSNVNDGVVITNGLFGGFQSPLVGNIDIRSSNAAEVASSVSYLTSTSTVGMNTY